MNHFEFFPYHNHHILFRISNQETLSGLLIDKMKFDPSGRYSTSYTFILTDNIPLWKLAHRAKDQKTIESLQTEIDIQTIVWAVQLNS